MLNIPVFICHIYINKIVYVFSKFVVKTKSKSWILQHKAQAVVFVHDKYLIHRVSLNFQHCSNSLVRHYCVEAGIFSPSSSK